MVGTRTVNWNKPWGQVTPPMHGAHIEQDGHYFDQHGNELHIPGYSPSLAQQQRVQGAPVGGVNVPPAAAPAAVAAAPVVDDQKRSLNGYTLADLVMMAEDEAISFQYLRKEARSILDDCPGDKAGIVGALKQQIFDDAMGAATYQPKTPENVAAEQQQPAGMTYAAMTGQQKPAAAPVPQQPPAAETAPAAPAARAAPAAAPEPPAAQAPATAAPSAPDPAQTPPEAPKVTPEATQTAPPSPEVDLAAWARGQQEYIFGDVIKAIDEKYSRKMQDGPNAVQDAVNFLVDEGLIPQAEARKVKSEPRPEIEGGGG